jgi:hypothetical protein
MNNNDILNTYTKTNNSNNNNSNNVQKKNIKTINPMLNYVKSFIDTDSPFSTISFIVNNVQFFNIFKNKTETIQKTIQILEIVNLNPQKKTSVELYCYKRFIKSLHQLFCLGLNNESKNTCIKTIRRNTNNNNNSNNSNNNTNTAYKNIPNFDYIIHFIKIISASTINLPSEMCFDLFHDMDIKRAPYFAHTCFKKIEIDLLSFIKPSVYNTNNSNSNDMTELQSLFDKYTKSRDDVVFNEVEYAKSLRNPESQLNIDSNELLKKIKNIKNTKRQLTNHIFNFLFTPNFKRDEKNALLNTINDKFTSA